MLALAALILAGTVLGAQVGLEPPSGEEPPYRDALAPKPTLRFALELAGTCRGRPLPAPAWCPRPEQPGLGPEGEIVVSVGDEVELELTVPLLFAAGRHAFMIVAADALERPDPRSAFGPSLEFGVPGVQLLKIRPDREGEFVFLEPYGRTAGARFSVRP